MVNLLHVNVSATLMAVAGRWSGDSVIRSPTGNVLGTTYHKLYCTV